MANKGQKLQRRPERCVGECNRLLVTRYAQIEDPELQAVHNGKGLCNVCWNRTRRREVTVRQRTPRPEKCVTCKVKLHPRRQGPSTEESKPYFGNGLCITCYGRAERELQAQVDILMGNRSRMPNSRTRKPIIRDYRY